MFKELPFLPARPISFDEICARLRQQLSCRWNYLSYRLGIQSFPKRFQGDASNLNLESRQEFVASLAARLPNRVNEILNRAEAILNHQFDVLGYERVHYGGKIDWHSDPVHLKRAPWKPWFKVPYLDFNNVGDSKIIWEINRHQHLVTLALAHVLTSDDRFFAELRAQFYDWREHNPYPMGINWASSLEVAFRSLSWIRICELLMASAAFRTKMMPDMLVQLELSGRHIEENLSTYFSPNTHLLGEAVALFFIGTKFPCFSSATRWKTLGWQVTSAELHNQVREDGFHFEQSTYYHVYALDFFLHARMLAVASGCEVPLAFDRKLEQMLEVLHQLSRFSSPPRFGDDDGGRLYDPIRNHALQLLDPLATGAVLFDRPEFKASVPDLCEETIWLLGSRGVTHFDRMKPKRAPLRSASFSDSGIYVLASSEMQMCVDAGLQGTGNSGHGHADALSVTLSHGGRELLVDPGAYQYTGPFNGRNLFRGTRAHNTLIVDLQDQAEARGLFSWSNLPDVSVDSWQAGKHFTLLRARHDGYQRLRNGITHERWVLVTDTALSFIRDSVTGAGEHAFEVNWHLSPDVRVELLENGANCWWIDGPYLSTTTATTNWRCETVDSLISPAYGKLQKNVTLRFSSRSTAPAEITTVFDISSVENRTCARPWVKKLDSTGLAAYSYENGASHFIAYGKSGSLWRTESYESDAELLYESSGPDRALKSLAIFNAQFIRVRDAEAVRFSKPVPLIEYIAESNVLNISGAGDEDWQSAKEFTQSVQALHITTTTRGDRE